MKRMFLLMLLMITCTSCTALPAEERAFAVALLVEKEDDTWRVHGRIPTYQTGGGYRTVTGEGGGFSAALADMDAAAPMHLHLSQLRLLVLDDSLGKSGELRSILSALSDRVDVRQRCAVAVTDAPVKELAEALKPSTGARLSKTIDVLLDTRIEQGAILPADLTEVIRMGERQSPVLIALSLAKDEISLAGGYPLNADARLGAPLSQEETALLSLLLGRAKTLRITREEGSAEVRDASAKITLSKDLQIATVTLKIRITSSSFTPEGLEQLLADECLTLLSRMSAEGCDVLGLGRKAIMHCRDMDEWHELGWPDRYRQIQWSVAVGVTGPA